jgi:hypothetical protein
MAINSKEAGVSAPEATGGIHSETTALPEPAVTPFPCDSRGHIKTRSHGNTMIMAVTSRA